MSRKTPNHHQRLQSARSEDGSVINTSHTPWLFLCDRLEAQEILLARRSEGNILLRTTISTRETGKYAISYRKDLPNKDPNGVSIKFNHYKVQSTPAGFIIQIDKQPAPVACLEDVLKFFISWLGDGTKALNFNPPPTTNNSNNGAQYLNPIKSSDVAYVNVPQVSSTKTQGFVKIKLPDYENLRNQDGSSSSDEDFEYLPPNLTSAPDYVNVPKLTPTHRLLKTHSFDEVATHTNSVDRRSSLPTGLKTHDYINIQNQRPAQPAGRHTDSTYLTMDKCSRLTSNYQELDQRSRRTTVTSINEIPDDLPAERPPSPPKAGKKIK